MRQTEQDKGDLRKSAERCLNASVVQEEDEYKEQPVEVLQEEAEE